jgi:hypothetical protein
VSVDDIVGMEEETAVVEAKVDVLNVVDIDEIVLVLELVNVDEMTVELELL